MPRSDRQKLKLLYIMKILSEETDEKHPMPMNVLLDKLSSDGIQAERKSIYNDLECLTLFGEDISFNSSRTCGGYFLASRVFELPELKILVDAVLSSRFITEQKSNILISKIEQLTSKHEAMQLQRQLYHTGRIKNENESIYYHIDAIETAIQENKKIQFKYMAWTIDKKLAEKNNGMVYIISPWALLWNDEKYYLVGFDEKASIIKHFRVDKMNQVDVVPENRIGKMEFEACNLQSYSSKTFGMYGGQEEIVTLQCRNDLAGVMIDRFGLDVILQKKSSDTFEIHVKVAISNQFFGWISGIGNTVHIVAPSEVQEKYKTYLENILLQYSS